MGAFLQTPAPVLNKISGPMGARFLSSTGLGSGNLIERAQFPPVPILDKNRSPILEAFACEQTNVNVGLGTPTPRDAWRPTGEALQNNGPAEHDKHERSQVQRADVWRTDTHAGQPDLDLTSCLAAPYRSPQAADARGSKTESAGPSDPGAPAERISKGV